jgi:LysM repeat protein
MQQYERFGVLALLLLVVTLVAVALLGEDPRDPSRLEELAVQAAERPGAAAEALAPGLGGAAANRPQGERPVPRRGAGAQDPRLVGSQERPAPTARRRPETPERTQQAEPETPLAQAGEDLVLAPRPPEPELVAPRPWPERAVPAVLTPPRPEAASAQASAAGPSAPSRPYTVQPGDCLGTILQEQCGTVRAQSKVLALNPGLDPDRLRAGQVLQLPATSAAAEASFKRPGRIQEVGVLDVVVVQSGDSLYRILQRERSGSVSIEQVLACNPGLDPNLLRPGQELRLPQASQRRSVPASRYIVREGDILGRIAVSLGCTLEELVAVNPGLQPDRIRSGQVLLLPPGVGTALAGAR